MTLFAGAYSLNQHEPLPAQLLSELRAHLSRHPGDAPREYAAPGFFALDVDIGAFGAPGALRDDAGAVTLVAGEPLLADGEDDPGWNRAHDVALLHRGFLHDSLDGLRRSRGTFCGLHYNPAGHTLSLFVDKTGVRPLYVWECPGYVVFASALRVLEALTVTPRRLDLRGVTEIAAFSFPLAERTPYLDIAMLKAGHAAQVAQGRVEHAPYWRWDGPIAQTDYDTAVRASYEQFLKAIRRRQRGRATAAAFLSGGLDSRVIVGGLACSGSRVFTVNYAPDGSQDQVFATLVAQQLGTDHTQLQTNAGNVGQGYRKSAVNGWIRDTYAPAAAVGGAPLVWSGDGGSVGLGNVYMTPQIVDAMERGAPDQAIALFTTGLPRRIFRRDALGEVAGLPSRGIREELDAIDSPDPGRKFHLFLMFNDQRRHLAQHFEDIDVDRIEFQLPFFDADFLDSVLRMPNDWFMAHRFYMDWLALFPNGLASIPWQAYPGHIPCTLPSPPGLKYQWEEYYDKAMYAQMRRASADRGRKLLAQPHFPDHLISRGTLRLASLLTGTGLRDWGYLIKTADVYQRYWSATGDRAAA